MPRSVIFATLAIALCIPGICDAQQEKDSALRTVDSATQGSRTDPRATLPARVLNARVKAHWTGGDRFWFRKETGTGKGVIVDVDATTGEQTVRGTGDESTHSSAMALSPMSAPRSEGSADDTAITFVNKADSPVQLVWVASDGSRRKYATIEPGKSYSQHTFVGHAWEVVDREGGFYGSVVGNLPESSVTIDKKFERIKPEADQRSSQRRRRGGSGRRMSAASPVGKSEFAIEGGNLRLRADSDSPWVSLTTDGQDPSTLDSDDENAFHYSLAQWSPDGTTLIAWRTFPGETKEVHTIESSPDDGGRAKLRSRRYPLPGDRFTRYELVAFDRQSSDALSVSLEPIDFGSPRVRWHGEHELLVQKVDRGHKRFRLFAIDPQAETTKTLFDEQSETFVWTAHAGAVPTVTYLDDHDAAIVASERSGFRHLYWLDLSGQAPMRPITSGDWLVREIESIDETNETMILCVGGLHSDQDPYHRHFVRANFQGDDVLPLTDGNGNHSIQWSPDGRYLIASHSRVDSPPVHELRDASDGRLIGQLAAAERLGAPHRTPRLPEVFCAKGRDGQTDIWGMICFPEDYDPDATDSNHKYPVLEYIYAGPHGSHVPKAFRSGPWHRELTSLGFIVVQIDGMGTANRSKAFHDVCWQNLKDAGFPDRIAWMKSAAERHPAMDLSRVGIFGTSAGGQNACGALLFHGDFYKAAVAACGCHDNRMDKASWNEQWMGYPVGPHYAQSSNIDNANRLQGDLMLIVGELDSNVPPESTLRLADALIKADKDFDLLVIPGLGHSDGGQYGRRRTRDFFVEKLNP